MLKLLAPISLFFAFGLGAATMASAKTLTPPSPPGTRYMLPGTAADTPSNHLREGRSIYRREAPSTFYGGTDERGYQTGDPQNPQTGN